MDPNAIALILTVTLGVSLKFLDRHLRNKKPSVGSIVVSAKENYELRFKDPKYVEMIHDTRALELETLGSYQTECLCRACSTPPGGCGFMGCGASGCETFCRGRSTHDSIPKPAEPKQLPLRGQDKRYKHVVDGYVFNLDKNVVPEYAHGTWNSTRQMGVFTWTDPSTGHRMSMYALPEFDIIPDYYNTSNQKPVSKAVPRKESGIKLRTPIYNDEKTIMIFTTNGPKMISKSEQEEMFRTLTKRNTISRKEVY